MTGIEMGLLSFAVLVGLLALRIHVGIAMLLTGIGGYVALIGWMPLLAYLKTAAFARYSVYDLSVVPLFLLMGQFALRGGLSRGLFDAANAFIGHWRGGIAMGSIGILIPPSVVLVIYAILTEQNIAKLFLAAFVPGILAAFGYMVAIMVYVRLYPGSGPAGPRRSWRERFVALGRVWQVVTIFIVVIGGIYGGIFTPTEAAAVGVIATGAVALHSGGLSGSGWMECIYGTAQATGMIFLILLGADVLNVFLALTQMPVELATWVTGAGFPPLAVLFGIFVILLLLGCIMDSLSMILLTVPIFFPVIMGLEFFGLDSTEKAIWFGIMALMVVEIGLITPPVGMNVYIINSIARDVPMGVTFRGVVPFLCSDVVRIALLVSFPSISLFMVRLFG